MTIGRGQGEAMRPDLVDRVSHAGGSTHGGFARRSFAPGPPSRVTESRLPVAAINALLRGLDALLRDVVGLNVRQPSSSVPPFRATQWTYTDSRTIPGAGTVSRNIDFSNPAITPATAEQVPEGVRGVMALFKGWVFPDDAGSLVNLQASRFQVFKNGSLVPGMFNVPAGWFYNETTTDANGSDSRGAIIDPFEVLVPVKLEPGDTMSYTAFGASVDVQVNVVASGWFYPIEREADGVAGTVADRGSAGTPSGGIRI